MTEGITIRQGAYLPHWTREGAIYAVTFRLADALPKQVVKSWEFEREDILRTARKLKRPLTEIEEDRLDRLFSERVEKYLDAGVGECWMQREDVASVLATAVRHFEGVRYSLFAWCVMPNHVHTVIQPLPGYELSQISHSWKSFSARKRTA